MPRPMEIKVSVTDTEPFKKILTLLGDIVEDERIKPSIREEIHIKIEEIMEEK